MKNYHLLIFCIIVWSCDKPNEDDALVFDKVYQLHDLEEFSTPPILLKERYLVATEHFLVSLSDTQDSVFKVFDNKTLDYLGAFGTKGNGPQDFYPVASSFTALENDVLFVGNRRGNIQVKLSKPLKGSSSKFHVDVLEQVYIPGQLIPMNNGFRLDEAVYGGNNRRTDFQIALFNSENGEINKIFPFPSLVADMPINTFDVLYQRIIRLSKDRKKIVAAYTFFPTILIYDIDKDKVVTEVNVDMSPYLNDNIEALSDGRNINANELYTYYSDLLLTDNNMYVKFQMSGLKNGIRQQINGKELYVFDKEGVPLVRLVLEDWMNKFAVTPNDEYIYFWHPEIEDKLFRFKLSNALK